MDKQQNSLHIPLDFEPDPDKFAADGYHPSEDSYAEFGRHVAERLIAMAEIDRDAAPMRCSDAH